MMNRYIFCGLYEKTKFEDIFQIRNVKNYLKIHLTSVHRLRLN